MNILQWRRGLLFLSAVLCAEFAIVRVSLGEEPRVILSCPLKNIPLPPMVPVRMQEASVMMMLDTGATLMKLDSRFADFLVKTDQTELATTANGVQMLLPLGLVPSFQLGSKKITQAYASVVSFQPFQEFFGVEYQGSVPYSVLVGTALKLDFDSAILEILDGKIDMPPDWSHLPVALSSDGGCPLVHLTVHGADVDFLIDTGYNGCCSISAELAQKLLAADQAVMPSLQGKSLDGNGTVTAGKIGGFKSGTLMGKDLKGVEFSVTEGTPKLGMSWFLAFNLILDTRQSKLFYKLRENPPPPIAPESMTGAVFQFAKEKLVIARLRPGGGPAQTAGLQVGDVVTRLGGVDHLHLDGPTVYELIAKSSGKRIECEYIRDGDLKNVRHSVIEVGKTKSRWDFSGDQKN